MEGQESTNTEETDSGFWMKDGELRLVWRIVSFTAIYFFAYTLLLVIAFFLPLGDYSRFGYTAASLVAGIIATWFACAGIESMPFSYVGFPRMRAVRDVALGAGYGAVLVAVAVLFLLVFGSISFSLSKVTFSAAAGALAKGAVLFALVASSEEILMRGYPFQVIMKKHKSIVALLLTSMFFALVHYPNPNITIHALLNIFIAGLMLGSAYIVSGSLWFPIGLHFGWNFFQGTVLGFPVSGIIGDSVFVAVPSGADVVSGGLFGLEGSIAATGILALGAAGLWFEPVRRLFSGNSGMDAEVHKENADNTEQFE